jgi:hypothetical protein
MGGIASGDDIIVPIAMMVWTPELVRVSMA